MDKNIDLLVKILDVQLGHFWNGLYNIHKIERGVKHSYSAVCECYRKTVTKTNDQYITNIYYNSKYWSIFLYYLSHKMFLEGNRDEADCVYYLNKVMNSVDWYYEIELPKHFMVEHPLGSVLGRAKYGDYLFIYQGVTIGGNYNREGELRYPIIGNNVLLYADSTVLGNSVIGDNVIVSGGSYIKNENIPSNSIVFGRTPNVKVKNMDGKEIAQRFSKYWK